MAISARFSALAGYVVGLIFKVQQRREEKHQVRFE